MAQFKILVIGEICTDVYVYGSCTRLCPEGPIPVFTETNRTIAAGMAGNVANNLMALGAKVYTCSQFNQILKTRYVEEARNHLLLRVDVDGPVDKFSRDFCPTLSDYDAIAISDYNKGFLNVADIHDICCDHKLVFVDTKKKVGEWLEPAAFIKVNEAEYANSQDYVGSNLELAAKLVITLGPSGCCYQGKQYPTKKLEVVDIAGAGDTFMAGLVVKYLETKKIDSALKFANKCAGQVVQNRGTTVVDPAKFKA